MSNTRGIYMFTLSHQRHPHLPILFQTYSNCSCVEYVTGGASSTVTAGKCNSDCVTIPVFVALLIVLLVVTFMPMVPATHITLR